jgi:hypothetical protein
VPGALAAIPAQPLTCPACGARYACRPGQGCWCESLPPVMKVPQLGQCLCPCQLGASAPTDTSEP